MTELEPCEFAQWVGRVYTFDDGASMTIIQIKRRDTGWWITYEATFAGCLPRRLIMHESEFIQLYGYLFTGDDSKQ